jgi:peptidyl-prolyl cis-trans isomerase SurA
MKKTLLFLLLTAGTLLAQTNAGPVVTAVDGYAARVDSTIITYGEVRESVAPYLQQLQKQLQGEELALQIQQAFREAREALIEEALLKEEVKLLGLNLPDAFVNEEINRLIRERFEDDRAILTRALAARRMTFEEWRQEVADQLTVRVFYGQEVTRRASVPLQAVQAEYERTKKDYFRPLKVKLRLIVAGKGKTDQDRGLKKQQLEEVLQKVRDGADFAVIAKEISEGDAAESPWREVNDVREELRPALLNTPAGGVSDLIETPGEFYIVKIEERREEGFAPFEEVRAEIENRLLAMEQDRLHRQLIERLAAKHFVERY